MSVLYRYMHRYHVIIDTTLTFRIETELVSFKRILKLSFEKMIERIEGPKALHTRLNK